MTSIDVTNKIYSSFAPVHQDQQPSHFVCQLDGQIRRFGVWFLARSAAMKASEQDLVVKVEAVYE